MRYNFNFDTLYVQDKLMDSEFAKRMIQELNPSEIISWHLLNDIPKKYTERDVKSLIIINTKSYLKESMPGSKDLMCTPFMELRFASYCPLGCHYCYLNRVFRYKLVPKVGADLLGRGKDQLHKYLIERGNRKRSPIVVGELSDGMIFDRLLHMSPMLAEVAADHPKVIYIILSKPFLNDIENYYNIPEELRHHFIHVISFNPQKIIDYTEELTPSFKERLEVAKELYKLGYKIRLRLDPLFGDDHLPSILYPGESKSLYENMLIQIKASGIDFDKVTLGVYRGFSGLVHVLNKIYPDNLIQHIKSGSKKSNNKIGKKYIVQNKLDVYRDVVGAIRDLFPGKNISFCRDQVMVFREFKIKPLDCVCKP